MPPSLTFWLKRFWRDLLWPHHGMSGTDLFGGMFILCGPLAAFHFWLQNDDEGTAASLRLILLGIAIFLVGRALRNVLPRPHPEVERLREAADKGEVELQYKLGTMYAEGVEVPEDFAEAAKWYRMAAERGDVEAQYKLAVIYEFGRGVALDYSEAAKWYLQAAEQADDLTNRFDAASVGRAFSWSVIRDRPGCSARFIPRPLNGTVLR